MAEIPPPKIDIKNHWNLPLREQENQLRRLVNHDEEVALRKSLQIRYRGKMIDPEDYPCKCELMNPSQCWEEKHPNARDHQSGVCKCRCHSTYED